MLSFGYAEFRRSRIKRHLQAGSWPFVGIELYLSLAPLMGLTEQRLAISLIGNVVMSASGVASNGKMPYR
jgi:hypothetical protein